MSSCALLQATLQARLAETGVHLEGGGEGGGEGVGGGGEGEGEGGEAVWARALRGGVGSSPHLFPAFGRGVGEETEEEDEGGGGGAAASGGAM